MKEFKVVISHTARASLKSIIKYISKKTSSKAAEKVRFELIQVAKSLNISPTRFSMELAIFLPMRLRKKIVGSIASEKRKAS